MQGTQVQPLVKKYVPHATTKDPSAAKLTK